MPSARRRRQRPLPAGKRDALERHRQERAAAAVRLVRRLLGGDVVRVRADAGLVRVLHARAHQEPQHPDDQRDGAAEDGVREGAQLHGGGAARGARPLPRDVRPGHDGLAGRPAARRRRGGRGGPVPRQDGEGHQFRPVA